MTLHPFHAKRRLAAWIQAVIVLGLPFVQTGGESALRFDVPSLKLYFFGSVIWISEAYFFLLVSLLFFIGVMLNTYSLFVENRSLEPEEYLLGLSGVKDAELVISRNPFMMPPNAMVKFTIYVFARRSSLRERITRLQFTLKSTRSSEIRITREAPFLYSERTEKGVEI